MKNRDIFEESKKYIPGGVNSPVRAYSDIGITPPIIKEGKGAYLLDEEDNRYTDYVGAWGPMILGHLDDDVMREVEQTLKKGVSFGSPTKMELKLAKHICTTVENVEMIRMVNSGTEATMSAVRLARGYTKRDKVVKFEGCYHGHYDGFLISAGSGVMTEGIPGSAGVPRDIINNTLLARYNDVKNIKEIFNKYGEEIAAVILEPVAGNMGLIPAEKEFLEEVRKLCDEYESVLIFDEVMTGFRVDYGGAKKLYNIEPDIISYAKVIGGGFPSGAYGGKKEIMEHLSPIGEVYQAGTMSGNPVVMSAGYATLKKLYENIEYYGYLRKLAEKLEDGVKEIASEKGLPIVINRFESMLTIFYTEEKEVKNYEDAQKSDTKRYSSIFKHMIKNGIYMSPSQFEVLFLSVKHTNDDIEKFLETLKKY